MPGNELEVLSHYKRKIEKNPDNEEVLLRSLAKLDGVRVNIALLQDTGIGRTVSLLKKKYGDQEIGTKSRDLVTKWKDIVAREESDEDKDPATGDEEAPEVETNGHGSPPSYNPTPIAPAYVPTPKSGYVPTPLSELKHESRDSENHTSDDPYENESEEHNGTNGYGETEVTHRNGEDSDREQHKKSKKHKKDKDREKDRKEKHRHDEEKEKLKKKKSSHRDNSEQETETRKTEVKSEYIKKETIKKETISHSSPPKKDKSDKEQRTDKVKEEKRDKYTHEDKYSSREDRKDKDKEKREKQTKEKESREKSREHKSSDHKSKHEKSNGEHSRSSSSKHSDSRDKEDKDKERKSHKDKHRDKERTKDESDKKHTKSKDRPKSETEESQDRSEKQRLKDKKKKSENASMGGFDMFASMDTNGDKKHKKRPREDSTEETEVSVKSEEMYKPTSKQSRVDSSSDYEHSGSNGFTAVMDHKKFKLPTPPTIDPTSFSSGPSFIPDISPHYKPLPRAPPPPNNHKVDEGVTLDALIASRGKRQMAVYSGAKRGCGFKGEVPSLRDQCIQKLQDNVDDIYECGGLSFDVLEPILNRASPETLMQIELYNPYLMEDTGTIWERFCKKEFRNKQRNADDFESWREMYERCIREREEKLLRLKDKVSKNFNARGEAKDSAARQTKMAFVDQVSKPPREVRVQQAKNGTALPVGHSFRPGAGNSKVGMRSSDPTARSGGSVVSSKKPKTAPMMAKVRRMMRR